MVMYSCKQIVSFLNRGLIIKYAREIAFNFLPGD